jgi:Asp-tRNA(Asn)/Glu-tRNA(Gln) amidotransferase C subunit
MPASIPSWALSDLQLHVEDKDLVLDSEVGYSWHGTALFFIIMILSHLLEQIFHLASLAHIELKPLGSERDSLRGELCSIIRCAHTLKSLDLEDADGVLPGCSPLEVDSPWRLTPTIAAAILNQAPARAGNLFSMPPAK